jgi:hypothetical protein
MKQSKLIKFVPYIIPVAFGIAAIVGMIKFGTFKDYYLGCVCLIGVIGMACGVYALGSDSKSASS